MPADSPSHQHRNFLPTGLFSLILIFAVLGSRLLYAPSDDAFIFLVYAKNFIQGNGLTFNGTIVEGFSSPLWVALLSLIGFLGIPLPVLMQLLSTFSGGLALYATYRLGLIVIKDRYWALLPPALLAGSGDFIFYMGVGLEQVLFVGLIALSVAEVWGDMETALKRFRLPFLLALVILTRPEGGLTVLLILVWGLYQLKSLWLPLQAGLKMTAILAPVMVLKRAYYGYWLPNTFYVKSNSGLMNADLGKIYLIRNGLRYWPVAVLLVLIVVLLLFQKRTKVVWSVFPLLLISAVWGGYVWIVGGDNLVGGRMLIPVLPLVYVALILLLHSLKLKIRWAAVITLICASILFYGYAQNNYVQIHAERWRRNFPVRQAAGLYLKEHFPPDTLVALNPAGIIPYFSELPTIDMLGLNDLYIAHFGQRDYNLDFGHQAGDGHYVISQKPDIILFGGGVSAVPGDMLSDRQIAQHPDFETLYQPVVWPGIGTAYIRSQTE